MNEFDSLINETNPIEKEEIYTESFRAGKRTYFFEAAITNSFNQNTWNISAQQKYGEQK